MATFRQRALNEAASHQTDRYYVEEGPVSEYFGKNVLDLDKMQAYMSPQAYEAVLASVKFGAKKADKGNIILVTMLWASSGIFGGALILAAAELAAILFYILPNYIIAKKQKRPVPFSEIRYPLSPFLFICYYAAVSVGIF